jgi:RND family efflux transporter MFP subunit
VVVAAGGIGAFFWSRSGKGDTGNGKGQAPHAAAEARQEAAPALAVQVVKPHRGGMARTTEMPGTIRAFKFAPLYAKVSGYLKELNVDRGDRVKKGQLLALVYDPEVDVAVLQAQAALEHSRAMEKQAEAKVKTAEAGVKAAEARRNQANSTLEQTVAQRTYRKKALDRLAALASRNAVEQQLVDEQEDQYMSAQAAEHAAQAGIDTAEAQLAEAKAAVELAQADLKTARSEISISEANLAKAKVLASYTRIEAPFDGVVTFRGEGIHPGAFIRAATEGSMEPLLTVAWTDKMRTIVPVPDPDVPFANPGDPATVRLDAMGSKVFKGVISRTAEAEDLKDRTMRVEVDLPNKDGLLRDGMYGRAVIQLEPPSNNLSIPATALVDHNTEGEASVFVVAGGKVEKRKVRVGRDNGLEVEALSGLSPDDEVIAQPTSAITQGMTVRTEGAGRADGASSAEERH